MSAPASLCPFHLAHGGGWRVLHSLYITSINLLDLLQGLAVAMTGKAIKCSRGRGLYSGVLSTVPESRALREERGGKLPNMETVTQQEEWNEGSGL